MTDMGPGPFFPLSEVPDHVDRLRRGKKIHKATPRRWAKHGVAGVKLRTICIGGTLCTSQACLSEFFGRLTALRNPDDAAPTVITKSARRIPRGEVDKRLEEIGL